MSSCFRPGLLQRKNHEDIQESVVLFLLQGEQKTILGGAKSFLDDWCHLSGLMAKKKGAFR